jgi:DNA-binding response OmpR family regulator
MKYYVAIEKVLERFERFRTMWNKLGVDGVIADTMQEGIRKAMEIEKSTGDVLYFISIVADEIKYMEHLSILSRETRAPILIATSSYVDVEHHMALNKGADFYGQFCVPPERNISAVVSTINSIERRANKRGIVSGIMTYDDILISTDVHLCIVVDIEIKLTRIEMDILHYLMLNRGLTMTHSLLIQQIWPDDFNVSLDSLYSNMKRLKDKLRAVNGREYIETVKDVGYRLV